MLIRGPVLSMVTNEFAGRLARGIWFLLVCYLVARRLATKLAFWSGMDDSVWANGRGGMVSLKRGLPRGETWR